MTHTSADIFYVPRTNSSVSYSLVHKSMENMHVFEFGFSMFLLSDSDPSMVQRIQPSEGWSSMVCNGNSGQNKN